MKTTHIRSACDLRDSYAELAELVKGHDHVVITNNGKRESVLISIEDFEKYREYLHTRYIDEKLAEAEAYAARPDAKWYTHEEFWEKMNEKYEL